MTNKDKEEIKFWKKAISIIKKGYDCSCKTSDLEDMPKTFKTAQSVFHSGRCPSCRASEVCDWISEHINLLKI